MTLHWQIDPKWKVIIPLVLLLLWLLWVANT